MKALLGLAVPAALYAVWHRRPPEVLADPELYDLPILDPRTLRTFLVPPQTTYTIGYRDPSRWDA